MPKKSDKNAGNTGPILLIPEFCAMTGTVLLKNFERDFTMKKELDSITKLNPNVRYDRLRRFLDTIKTNPDAKQDLDNWKISFSDDVIKVPATHMIPITVTFGNDSVSNTERGWDKCMRTYSHLSAVPLQNWILMFMARDKGKAQLFSSEMAQVSGPMRFQVEPPQM